MCSLTSPIHQIRKGVRVIWNSNEVDISLLGGDKEMSRWLSEPMLLATFLGVEAKCNGKTLRQESDQRKNSRSMSPERMIWVSNWHSLEMTKGVLNLALTAPCAMAISAASCTLGTLSHDLGLTVRFQQPCG